ncbi:MAG: ATP-binding protein [Syntrophorhabdales bacterium]|jgi:anti-sigma regulatory factor (Ser/Thr protein kinase)
MEKGLDSGMNEEIRIPARNDAIFRAMEFVSAYARGMTFEEKRIGEIQLALEETLGNIIRFACLAGSEEIVLTCTAHETGAILVTIVDSGVPFNMLVMSTFPETTDASPDQIPSTRRMKKAIRDVEYRRDGQEKKNILSWVISR